MTFWAINSIQPMKKYTFRVSVGSGDDFSFLAKSVTKPTLETDVNEYRLINQIVKFPTVPKWNDINVKYVDTIENKIYENLLELMIPSQSLSKEYQADAIEKKDVNLVIEQLSADGDLVQVWMFKNAFIKSINFGDNSYSDEDLVEIDVNIAYDYAYLEEKSFFS